MKNWKLFALVFSVFGLSVLAQTNAVPVAAKPAQDLSGMGLLLIVIPLGVPIIVAIAKFFIPKLPGWSLPIIAPSLGALIDLVTSKITGGTFSPVTAALLGSAGVGIREILDQIKQQMITPASSASTPPKP